MPVETVILAGHLENGILSPHLHSHCGMSLICGWPAAWFEHERVSATAATRSGILNKGLNV